ncbi:MAG TPA: hypothetical protein DDW42_04920 [Desulfobacteraceae bacterium]|nr:hypothetical protein [Desulfobacteraceae bacterium]
MMKIDECPDTLDGATVLSAGLPRENGCSLIDGQEVPIVAYAIAKYDTEDGYYLFALSESWTVIGDTYWPSLDEAKRQGEYEAGILLDDWKDRR